MNEPQSIVREIVGYEGLYSIDEYGNVYSKRRPRTKGGKLKQHINWKGYAMTSISKNGKAFNTGTHRLVAAAFIPNPDNLPQVNHKDGNKLNNHVDNLEWCTSQQNHIHGRATGLFNIPKGEQLGQSKLTVADVEAIKTRYRDGERPYLIAKDFTKIHYNNVLLICQGKSWKHVTI